MIWSINFKAEGLATAKLFLKDNNVTSIVSIYLSTSAGFRAKIDTIKETTDYKPNKPKDQKKTTALQKRKTFANQAQVTLNSMSIALHCFSYTTKYVVCYAHRTAAHCGRCQSANWWMSYEAKANAITRKKAGMTHSFP